MSRMRQTKFNKRPMRGLALGIFLALGGALVLLQTAPSIRAAFLPVQAAASDQLVGNGKASWLARVTGQTARNERIEALETEVRELSRWQSVAISMAERLEAYEQILNMVGEPPVNSITARVIAESNGPFADTLLANAGQSHGIEIGSVATNEGGLVGRVVQFGQRSSRILVVTDFNSRVPVMGETSGVRAIMYGGRDGRGVLEDRPETDQFIEGERILTTGEGGLYPRGIVAGFALKRNNDAWRVNFAMRTGSTGYVRLVPPVRIPTPEEAPPLENTGGEVSEIKVSEIGPAVRLAGQ